MGKEYTLIPVSLRASSKTSPKAFSSANIPAGGKRPSRLAAGQRRDKKLATLQGALDSTTAPTNRRTA